MLDIPVRSRALSLSVCLFLTLLAACGGGGGADDGANASGGGGGNAPPPNSPPTADAGQPFSAREGEEVMLAGSGSDADGTIAAFAWRQTAGPAVTLSSPSPGSAIARFDVPDIAADTSATFELTVTDDDGASATDLIEVTLLANFTLSGTVFAAPGIDADGDVNDAFTPLARNDTFDTAQAVNNPVLLGGFANKPGRGDASGQLTAGGDERDYFVVDAVADQVVSLFIEAERTAINDLDLSLYDADRTLVDRSISITSFEQITIPADGRYFVEVFAFSGASNYVLRIGQPTAPGSSGARAGALLLSDPFVAGEALVRFDEPALAAAGGAAALAAREGLRITGGGPQRPRRVDVSAWQGVRGGRGAGGAAQRTDAFKTLPSAGVTPAQQARLDTLLAIKALQARDDVEWAAPNHLYQPLLVPDDEFYSLQWHYRSISLPAAWDLTQGDEGIVVAVIDTGVLTDHPDFAGKFVPGYDFISDPANAGDGDGIDPDPNDPGDLANGGTSSFHGTHVAGTVGARTDNARGVAGAGWNTRIMPLRALGRFGGSEADIAEAIRFAAGLPNDSGTLPAQPADVINLSLGGPSFSQATQNLINEVRAAGVIVVAAAGNSSTREPSYPAAYDGVVSVSSVTIDAALAGYSNFGPTIDIAAPGGSTASDINGDGFGDGVLSTAGDDSGGDIALGYTFLQGTSMAAPHVAGVVALMKSVFPALSPALLDGFIAGGTLTEDLGPEGRDDQFGHGLVNAFDAVVTAIGAAGGELPPPRPVLVVSPPALNFGVSITTLALSVSNGGTGDLLVDPPAVDPSVAWLTVEPAGAADSGEGSWLVRVSRDGLPAGTFQSEVVFPSNGGDVRLPVIMQVADEDTPTGNAGNQFILLIDNDTGSVLDQAEPGVVIDSAPYGFENVPPGSYVIIGGTDNDSDGFICDAAESCGAFPVLDPLELQTVTIEGDRDGLDYVTTFNSELASPEVLAARAAAAAADAAAARNAASAPSALPAQRGEGQVMRAVRGLIGHTGVPIRRGANVLETAAAVPADGGER